MIRKGKVLATSRPCAIDMHTTVAVGCLRGSNRDQNFLRLVMLERDRCGEEVRGVPSAGGWSGFVSNFEPCHHAPPSIYGLQRRAWGSEKGRVHAWNRGEREGRVSGMSLDQWLAVRQPRNPAPDDPSFTELVYTFWRQSSA